MDRIVFTVTELGTLIRECRKAQGYTQACLAALYNTGIRFISDLENGKETAEPGKALGVAATLGIDLVARTRGGNP